MLITASVVAIAAYLATAVTLLSYARKTPAIATPRQLVGGLIACGVVAHTISTYLNIATAQGLDLGFFPVSSLIFWFICCLALVTYLRHKPIDRLLLLLFPMAALSVAVSVLFESVYTPRNDLDGGIVAHILLSMLAYSVLTLAALQALLLGLQVRELKHKHTRGLIDALPPLQTMEQMLFELIWMGFILLGLSILSGVVFLQDIFAQHLVHKTTFSICAWVIFAMLLWGRTYFGWRGKTAVRWTLIGFALLMLGYFGSKVVLELILQRA
ncbi:MAG: cytochrome C assembly family protein [Pseudomonadales bacterium]